MKESITSLTQKKKFRLPLKYKVVLPLIALILFFGGIATLMVFRQLGDSLLDLHKERVKTLTLKQGKETSLIFEKNKELVAVIAEHPKVIEYLRDDRTPQEEEMLELLQNYNLGGHFSAIYLMTSEGDTLVSTNPSFVGKNYGFRDYFKDARVGIACVDTAIGVTSGELGYYFSHPIYIDQEIQGVAVVKMRPDTVNETLVAVVEAEELHTDFYITNKDGIVLHSTKHERTYSSLGVLDEDKKQEIIDKRKFEGVEINPLSYQEVQDNLSKTSVFTEYSFYDEKDGEEELLMVAPLEGCPFYVVSETKVGEIQSNANATAASVGALVSAAAIVAMTVISAFVARTLSPLTQLTNAAEAISQGESDLTVRVNTNDELQDLADAFNNMTEKLIQSKRNVEDKVEAQTEKLETQQLAILNVLEDVEEEKLISQKTAENLEKFELAVSNVSDHIIITDPEGIILYANPAVETITGFSPKEILGKKAGDKSLWGGIMPADFYKKMWKTIKEEKESFVGEITNKKKDGTEYIAAANISPILNQEGDPIFFVGIERDITKEKEVDRMKTEFISLASHQLRTPLSAMKWFLEMLLDDDAGKLKKEQREYIENIDASNERMIALVNALLNISRIESGRIIIDPEPTDLRELIDTVLGELKMKLEKKKINPVISVNENLPKINIDPKLIRNVYMNLLTNAIKYTPEGGEINVFVSRKGEEVISQVSDTGYGIPEEEQDKVFKKFYRGANILKVETDGTGLGLYLVKAVVESSGGKVWFKSEEEKGTTFWFSLPMKGSKKKEGEVSLDA